MAMFSIALNAFASSPYLPLCHPQHIGPHIVCNGPFNTRYRFQYFYGKIIIKRYTRQMKYSNYANNKYDCDNICTLENAEYINVRNLGHPTS